MKLYLKAICIFFAILLLLGSLIWNRYQTLHTEHIKMREATITQFAIAILFTLLLVIYRIKCISSKHKRINLRNFLQNITNNIGEGLYTTDKNSTVTLINPEASRLLGYLSDEVVGMGRNNHE